MKSFFGLLAIGLSHIAPVSTNEIPAKNEQNFVINKDQVFSSTPLYPGFNVEVEEDSLESYRYKKTSNFSKSYVTLKRLESEEIEVKFNVKKVFKELVDMAKKEGQIKLKSFYDGMKDDILINAGSWLSSSSVYVTLNGDAADKKPQKTTLSRICGSALLTDDDNVCLISPLGKVKKMHFQLKLNPKDLIYHRKSAVTIDRIYNWISDPNPEKNTFYGTEIFNNKKIVEDQSDIIDLDSSISIWSKDKLAKGVNADFSDTVWANQNSIKKDLKSGLNLKITFDFDSNASIPFPSWFLWIPIALFFGPIFYYGIRKVAKI